jgi:2,3-bisphosphoglycerate-dependent phosphoglycerate mutase
MARLILQRHLKSQWNALDIWAGWCDNPLSDVGKGQAKEIASMLAKEKIDVAYSGALIRATETLLRIYDYIPERYPLFRYLHGGKMQTWSEFKDGSAGNYLPVYVAEELNERYYGDLQGMNKAEAKKKFGEEQVKKWRTSYNDAPPGGESGIDIYRRVLPFYQQYIEKDLKDGKNVLVVASHHSLRAMVKHIENISDDDMINVELGFGSLTSYDFDGKHLTKN